jgi:hypothetical protein
VRISKQEFRLFRFDAFFFSAKVADDFEALLKDREDVFRVWRSGPAVTYLMTNPRIAEGLAREHERSAIEKLKEQRRDMTAGLKSKNLEPASMDTPSVETTTEV